MPVPGANLFILCLDLSTINFKSLSVISQQFNKVFPLVAAPTPIVY